MTGVFIRPRATFASLILAPRWAGVLGLSTAVAAGASALFYSTEVGRLALVDQWDRAAFAVGFGLDDAGYGRLIEWSRYGEVYGALREVLTVAGLSVAVALAAFAMLRGRARVTAGQVLAVTAHASPILALRAIVASVAGYAREQASGTTSLAAWLPIVDQGSSAGRLLGMVDLLVVWWAVVAAMGIAGLFCRPARRVVPLFVGVYVGLALLLAGAAAALGPG